MKKILRLLRKCLGNETANLIFIGGLNAITILFRSRVVTFVGDSSVNGNKPISNGKVQLTLYLFRCDVVLALHVAFDAVRVRDLLLRSYEIYRRPQFLNHQRVGLAATYWRRSYHAAQMRHYSSKQ